MKLLSLVGQLVLTVVLLGVVGMLCRIGLNGVVNTVRRMPDNLVKRVLLVGEATKYKLPKHVTHADVIAVWQEARKLEKRARITKQLKAARSPYFSEIKFREVIFAVPDLSLRKRLINAYRASGKAWPAFMQTKLEEAQKELAKAQRRAESLPWLRAGLLAAFCVGIGATFFELYGAIAGALVGFFAGQGVIANARTERPEAVRLAQLEVESRRESASIGPGRPLFSDTEEETGEPDKPRHPNAAETPGTPAPAE